MTLFRVRYVHHHLDDNTIQTEHDIDAECELEALLYWLRDNLGVGIEADNQPAQETLDLSDPPAFKGTLAEIAAAFLAGDTALSFWVGDGHIWQASAVEPESTQECRTCGGAGRHAVTPEPEAREHD